MMVSDEEALPNIIVSTLNFPIKTIDLPVADDAGVDTSTAGDRTAIERSLAQPTVVRRCVTGDVAALADV